MKFILRLLWIALSTAFVFAETSPILSKEDERTLLSRLQSMSVAAPHPLFELHAKSLHALVQSELARAEMYPKESVMPQRIRADIAKIARGLEAGNDRWEAYRDAGMPLVVAYLSERDNTLQVYNLVLPREWDESKRYPLYVELHGSGGPEIRPLGWAGMTLVHAPNFQTRHSQINMYPMVERDGFHLLPYGRGNSNYEDIGAVDVLEAMHDLESRVSIDERRRYLFGFSMGGSGTFLMASDRPELWAAIAIMGGSPGLRDAADERAARLRDLPVFLWAGEKDEWYDGALRKGNLLKTTGLRPRMIKFSPNVGHDYPGEIQKNAHRFMQQFARDESGARQVVNTEDNNATSIPRPNAKTRRLRVSENRRFLVDQNSQPFFYLGDTAWELFHRLSREDVDVYLSDRAAKGFTVIQAVALAEMDGLHAPNFYGHIPLENDDPSRPSVKEGAANDYWDHVEYVIDRANQLGLTIALLPSWGDKWQKAKWGVGPEIFTPDNARVFGKWIGQRFGQKGIIWVMGGDRPIETETHRSIINAMAEGVKAGDQGANLMTFHPPGGNGSSTWWHAASWLDFNMRQNGHTVDYARYDSTLADYRRTPTKPVVDGEPVYEDHPVDFKQGDLGHTVSADVRRPLYWNLFNGAFGHTYGHHSIWQMYEASRTPANDPLLPWKEALHRPGSGQMQHARWLLESRPFLERIPDPALVQERAPKTAWPGRGRYRFVGTRDQAGTYAMIYAPVGRPFTVDLSNIRAEKIRAWWFNPRDGSSKLIEEFSHVSTREFSPPDFGELLDWILVLDDASKNYPAPGTKLEPRLLNNSVQ